MRQGSCNSYLARNVDSVLIKEVCLFQGRTYTEGTYWSDAGTAPSRYCHYRKMLVKGSVSSKITKLSRFSLDDSNLANELQIPRRTIIDSRFFFYSVDKPHQNP